MALISFRLDSLDVLGSNAPTSARPVAIGDSLSFNTHPAKFEDLIECTVSWTEDLESHSVKYMTFKATNNTAGDSKPLVPVFVQSSIYDQFSSSETDVVEFEITPEWQYGQLDKSGAGRFHCFVPNLLVSVYNLVYDALCALGHLAIADAMQDITELFVGEQLYSFHTIVAKSGDVLLVPSKLNSYSFGELKTITWQQDLMDQSAQYYCFFVPDKSQNGQDIIFFIQKEWWDLDTTTSENHISKIATKNQNGDYQFKIDAKSQYGQLDQSGTNRWVVYHDQERRPYQHRFVDAMSVQSGTQQDLVAGIFGYDAGEGLGNIIKGLFGDYLETFS